MHEITLGMKLRPLAGRYCIPQAIARKDIESGWRNLQAKYSDAGKTDVLFDGPLYHVDNIEGDEIVVRKGISFAQFVGIRDLVNRGEVAMGTAKLPRICGLLVVLQTINQEVVLFARTEGEWGRCYELPGYSVTPNFASLEAVYEHIIDTDCKLVEPYIQEVEIVGSKELARYLEWDILVSAKIGLSAQEVQALYPACLILSLEDLAPTKEKIEKEYALHPPSSELISAFLINLRS